jgi:hypothetical protein
LRRVTAIESGLLSGAASDAGLAGLFQAATSGDQVLLKLARYAAGVRRDWHRALKELRYLQRERAAKTIRLPPITWSASSNRRSATPRLSPQRLIGRLSAGRAPAVAALPCNSKPIPVHLERELAAHKRRDPPF